MKGTKTHVTCSIISAEEEHERRRSHRSSLNNPAVWRCASWVRTHRTNQLLRARVDSVSTLSLNYLDSADISGSQLLFSGRCKLRLRNGICIQVSTGRQNGEGRKWGSPHLLEFDIPRISFSLLTIPNPFSKFLGVY